MELRQVQGVLVNPVESTGDSVLRGVTWPRYTSLLFCGPSNCGKTTYKGRFARQLGLRVVPEMSYLLQDTYGEIEGDRQKSGKLASDDLVTPVIRGIFRCEQDAWAGDGFPRSVPQSKATVDGLNLSRVNIRPNFSLVMVHLLLGDDEVRRRAEDRGRDDDIEIDTRIEEYHDVTLPGLYWLANQQVPGLTVIEVDACTDIPDLEQSIREVERRIVSALMDREILTPR